MLDFSNSKILIVGDVMLDKYYFGKVDRISPEAPVPFPGGRAAVSMVLQPMSSTLNTIFPFSCRSR